MQKKKIKTKILVDFDHSVAFSVKSLAVQKNMKIKPTGRFFSKIIAYKFYLGSNWHVFIFEWRSEKNLFRK